jgi:hypothetical protein
MPEFLLFALRSPEVVFLASQVKERNLFMSRTRSCPGVVVESLEDRQLLSATHLRAPSFPTIIGQYSCSAVYSNGITETFTVLVTSHRGGSFVGTSPDFTNIVPSKFTGTVTHRGKVHFRLKPVHFPGLLVGNGSVNLAETEITAAIRVSVGPRSAKGTCTLVTQDQSVTG